MKIALAFLVLLLLGCSSRKYTYYFDYKTEPQLAENSAKSKILSEEALLPEIERVSLPSLESIKANSSAERAFLPDQSRISRRAKKEIKQEIKSVIRDVRNRGDLPSSTLSTERKATNPKNNGFAIAGMALVIGGWLLWWPLIIGGIIASAIGLKSERRVLATIALVLAIIGIVILLLANQHENFA